MTGQDRGLAVATARVSRPDWLRNAAGLRYAAYWRGTLQPRPTVNWRVSRDSVHERLLADSPLLSSCFRPSAAARCEAARCRALAQRAAGSVCCEMASARKSFLCAFP